ncbi:MAG TPA: methyltransferase domain-containing protein [Bacteroidales bacterium]|nr:methyltransferase domain-containing protein [Bacteroidales bacterium]
MNSPENNSCLCPQCKSILEPLHLIGNTDGLDGILSCFKCRISFTCRNGIVSFIPKPEKNGFTRRMDFFRAVNRVFYTPLTNMMFSFCGGVDYARREVLDRLEIHPGAKILETGVGPGNNFPYLKERSTGISFYGIDNQPGMLTQCRHNIKKWNLPCHLFLANAEELPFRDNYFDVVFHLGAINIYQDKKKAIDEMIRVARPGTRILIADETQKAVHYFEFFIGKQPKVCPPVDLIPDAMKEIRLDTIWKGFGFLISFRKPLQTRQKTIQVPARKREFPLLQ